MAGLLRAIRLKAAIETRLGRYLCYAAGEILLIFLGITLALWFSNLNEERRLREIERSTLDEITANLLVNADIFRTNMEADESSLADCEIIIELLDNHTPWSLDFSRAMNNCRTWSSPYLQNAAYESLKLRGTYLVSNSDIRLSIVDLYENVYEDLILDVDWSQRNFETSVWGPVFAKHIEHGGPDNTRPSNYETFVSSTDFRNALVRHMRLLEVSIIDQDMALNKTIRVMSIIEQSEN